MYLPYRAGVAKCMLCMHGSYTDHNIMTGSLVPYKPVYACLTTKPPIRIVS